MDASRNLFFASLLDDLELREFLSDAHKAG
jgi:hypothetical protein